MSVSAKKFSIRLWISDKGHVQYEAEADKLETLVEQAALKSVPVNTVPEFITHAKGNRKPLRSRRSGAILSREIPETA
jgi:hypothetical protein